MFFGSGSGFYSSNSNFGFQYDGSYRSRYQSAPRAAPRTEAEKQARRDLQREADEREASRRQQEREKRDPTIHLSRADQQFGDASMQTNTLQFNGYEPYGVIPWQTLITADEG
jgi:hypothetical protein